MINNDEWNNYFIPNTDILKNKLNITNNEQLKQIEKEVSLKKLTILNLKPIEGNFDAKHLCNIHKFIFEDIYDFAGKYRKTNIAKQTSFTDFNLIELSLNELLNNIDERVINNAYSDYLYAEALASVYHRLIRIHPFREGNGRTIREFIREYVQAKNYYFQDADYELKFSKVDSNLFLEGTLLSDSQLGILTLEFYKALTKTPKQKNITK